ncbi:hypothetical protein FHW37_115121 [Neorhizobium alkalisoli]|uniref:Uncharacterized protein n=1 Tax=Neorhizobium alkalisoli TaxID=528178 RepID=A0A561Q7R0_9HYPH|nr:hypothetical protein FHW37_115121 [Neorhizobium alkalisoli]
MAPPYDSRNNPRMDIELSALEERAEAEEHMAEALRILNATIRRVHRSGLSLAPRS